MKHYSLQCWNEDRPVMAEAGLAFAGDEEAMVVALELACGHERVELRRGEDLIAYLTRFAPPPHSARGPTN